VLPENFTGPEQGNLDRSERFFQDQSELIVGKAEAMSQNQQNPITFGEHCQAFLDHHPVHGFLPWRKTFRLNLQVIDRHEGSRTATLSTVFTSQMKGNFQQPRLKRSRLIELIEMSERPQKGLLTKIFDRLAIGHQATQNCPDPRPISLDQRAKGFPAAAPGLPDQLEFSFHPGENPFVEGTQNVSDHGVGA
jgi:hypothetical protein